jgi:hypothetical protein
MSCFSFYIFSTTKWVNRRVEQLLPRREGWDQWDWGGVGKRGKEGEYGTIKCVHM